MVEKKTGTASGNKNVVTKKSVTDIGGKKDGKEEKKEKDEMVRL